MGVRLVWKSYWLLTRGTKTRINGLTCIDIVEEPGKRQNQHYDHRWTEGHVRGNQKVTGNLTSETWRPVQIRASINTRHWLE